MSSRGTSTRPYVFIVLALLCLLTALPAQAKRRPKKRKPKPPTSVPVNIGVGPSFNSFTGPIAENQMWHYGIRLDICAVIDQKTIRENKHRIPKKYRKRVMGLNEVRYRPSIFIPDHLFISPRQDDTSIYGVTWRPLSLNLPFINTRAMKLNLGAGLVLTYAYIRNQADAPTFQETIHFIRPGVDVRAELTLVLSPSLLLSGGWTSAAYIPQQIEGAEAGLAGVDSPQEDSSIWHIGQAFVMLHFRFPYQVKL